MSTLHLNDLSREQRKAVADLLSHPFNRLNDRVDLHPALGPGYPGITVSVDDTDGDKVIDTWTVDFSVDSKTPATGKGTEKSTVKKRGAKTAEPAAEMTPDDGYLIDRVTFKVATDPSSGKKMVVFDSQGVCAKPAEVPALPVSTVPFVCDAFQGTITDWGQKRYTEDSVNVVRFVRTFIQPVHRNIDPHQVTTAARFAETVRGYQELHARRIIAGLAVAGAAFLTGVAGLALYFGLRKPDADEPATEPAGTLERVTGVVPPRRGPPTPPPVGLSQLDSLEVELSGGRTIAIQRNAVAQQIRFYYPRLRESKYARLVVELTRSAMRRLYDLRGDATAKVFAAEERRYGSLIPGAAPEVFIRRSVDADLRTMIDGSEGRVAAVQTAAAMRGEADRITKDPTHRDSLRAVIETLAGAAEEAAQSAGRGEVP